MDTLHKILDAMWKQGLSDIDFCKAVGINKSSVTDWKKGKTKSYMRHIPKIAEVLGVSEEYLLIDVKMPMPDQIDWFSKEILDLRPDERAKVKEYIKFIKSQRQE